MAKQRSTADVFDEFESSAERLADWVRHHALFLGLAVVAVIAGIWGTQWWMQRAQNREAAATAALAQVRSDYMVAMGGNPGSLEAPELANPEAARQIRSEFAERFQEVAEAHAGTVSGTLAALQALDLEAEEKAPEATLAELEAILAKAPRNPILRAIILQRTAQAYEAEGHMAEAAAAYEGAGAIKAFPLREFALADAARCYAAAGEPGKALALYDRIQAEAPDFVLPESHRMLRRELMAGAGS